MKYNIAVTILAAIACGILLSSCDSSRKIAVTAPTKPTPPTVPALPTAPKNVILLIGDGMGITQISSGMYSNNNKLNLERINTIGLHKSYSSDNLVTDSAAGATAFSCGVKTYNGAIAVNPDTIPVKTILEEAEDRGLKTGLVSTSSIVHATPASFIAHNDSRRNYEAIALDFLDTEIDYFVGGGSKFFERRADERNLSEELRQKGYTISNFFEAELTDFALEPGEKFGFLTAEDGAIPVSQGRDYFPLASRMATAHLNNQNEKGFFLMIESSQIDWGGHSNDANYIITEMLEFDQVIGEVLDFAEADGNTLVIVTADHETGGFAINKGSELGNLQTAFTTDQHTADLIPVFAYGPGSEAFSGIYENTAIHTKMMAALGWKATTD